MLLEFALACAAAFSLSAPQEELRVPAHAAYHDDSTDMGEQLALWFGWLEKGEVNCSVELKRPVGQSKSYELRVGDQKVYVLTQGDDEAAPLDFGSFQVNESGYQRFELVDTGEYSGKSEVVALVLEAANINEAHFNLKPRKNAASVHLAYPLGDLGEVEAFYCEVTADEDPLWTYYMATGWHRGYFGMQVNSETERRIIFSVWDSGNEAVDRDKVEDANRVQLVDRGEDVVTGSFGNEGTGGHSHLVFDWKTGEKQRFLVTAKADDETHTTFAGYYFRPDLKRWMLVSSWRAPKEGKLLRGLYSFSENFSGRNGHLLRKARFGQQWVRTKQGEWRELTRATFSHDATGKSDRMDRFMGMSDGEFFLSHGGFVEGEGVFGEAFDRQPTGTLPTTSNPLESGSWRAVLDSPGGELPFELSLETVGQILGDFNVESPAQESIQDPVITPTIVAKIHNGAEVIPCGEVQFDGDRIVISLPPYDSRLIAQVAADGRSMTGHWEKFVGKEELRTMPFSARLSDETRFPYDEGPHAFPMIPRGNAGGPSDFYLDTAREIDGRWQVDFAADANAAVGIFHASAGGPATGTFLTTLGDYRYLAGNYAYGRLRLSCFDGGHAFLFDAKMTEGGKLEGDFWSSTSWHEKWTATKDGEAALPDSFGLTTWDPGAKLGDFSFLNRDGESVPLDDPQFAGKARIISIFGTWCPNCNDEAAYLAELHERYGERGLAILGVAFELDDDLMRSADVVDRFRKRHGATWPVLFGTIADKAVASGSIRGLDKVRAFPTTLFIDANNQVRAVHTGFAGPATGSAHLHMRERVESLVEELLREAESQDK
ncbi:MAG: thiol-disulfide isomerase/thioredoxin [Bacteroidia bacterium]|jgi:thiol-disulfide isomerase/thioredoxin